MMKALKMGFFGLALGALGAVVFPAQEAAADEPAKAFVCCSSCNPRFQQCLNGVGNDALKILTCNLQRN